MVAHTFNPSTREAEIGGSLSSKSAWSTERIPGQPGLLHRETLSQKKSKKRKKRKEERRREGGREEGKQAGRHTDMRHENKNRDGDREAL